MKIKRNSNRPIITVITICFNAEKDIEKTILSVVSQTYQDIEYIIVDGGSKDGTVDIIRKYESRIAKWVSEPDKGIYDAMNKGIGMATGEWLNFMNAGDTLIHAKVVEQMVPCLKANECQIAYGNIIRLYDNHKERKYPIRKKKVDAVDFMIGNIDHQASFIRKSLFNKYGCYDTTYKLAADHHFFLNVVGIHKENCKYIDLDIAYFKMDGNSTKFKNEYSREKESMLQKEFGSLYNNMKELSEYRASSILKWLLKIRIAIKKTGFNSLVMRIVNYRR